jgi:hypothetical protein
MILSVLIPIRVSGSDTVAVLIPPLPAVIVRVPVFRFLSSNVSETKDVVKPDGCG